MKQRDNDRDTVINADVVLCCQYESPHYDFEKLKASVEKAVDAANEYETRLELNFRCLDQGITANSIPDEIKESINKAAIVIFEMSDRNENVMLELGASWGQGKQMIILREKSTKNDPLPFNIASMRYCTYSGAKIHLIEQWLRESLIDTVHGLNIEDFDQDNLEQFISRYISVVQTTESLRETVLDQLERCERNFYYVGSARLAPHMDESLEMYRQHLHNIASHRVVNIETLRELKDTPAAKKKDLVTHCVWLARYYELIRQGIMTLHHSDAIGRSGRGMSLLVFDQEEVDLVLGRLESGFNHRAFFLASEKAGHAAHSYAQLLVAKSTEVDEWDVGHYFSLSSDVTEVPESIAQVAGADLESLRSACAEYIDEELRKGK